MSSLIIFLSAVSHSMAQPVLPPSSQSNSSLNQTLLIKAPLIDVEYESPKIVVLGAREDLLLTTNGTLSPFWNAIDIAKQHGYTLNEVTTSGMGSEGNPTRFYAIMSRP